MPQNLAQNIPRSIVKERKSCVTTMVMQGTYKNLQSKLNLPGIGSLGQRNIVSNATLHKLKSNTNSFILKNNVPPYQHPGECQGQAEKILKGLRGTQAVPRQKATENTSLLAKVSTAISTSFGGNFKIRDAPITQSSELLQVYEKKGPYMIRGPGLSDIYDDHTLAVMAAVKIDMPHGPKTVVYALDCSDLSKDPQTEASWETASKTGKSHISQLSHEEANQNGAEARRIRFIDADALAKHMMEHYRHHQALGHTVPLPESTAKTPNVSHPKVMYAEDGIPRLTPREEAELQELLKEIYDYVDDQGVEEVEKFKNADYSQLAHNKK